MSDVALTPKKCAVCDKSLLQVVGSRRPRVVCSSCTVEALNRYEIAVRALKLIATPDEWTPPATVCAHLTLKALGEQ